MAQLPAQSVGPPEDAAVFVYLVRHAERADDGTNDPPLSPKGLERVEALRHLLADAELTHVHTTDLRRTRQTAEPLARDHGTRLAVYDPFDLPGFAESLKITPGRHLVSGHSNTTPALAAELGGDPGEGMGTMSEGEYDKVYLVILRPETEPVTILLRYGIPSGG